MGASVQPDPVADYLAAKQQASGDPVSDYLAARAGAVTPHGASGTWGDLPQGPSTAAHLLNTFSFPGMEMLEARAAQGASHVLPGMFGGQPISYQQSLDALRSVKGEIPSKTAALERFLGTMALAPVLPENPVTAGALLGGADQALSADPTSLMGRARNTAVGTGIGGAFGYLLGQAVPQGEALMRARGIEPVDAQQVAMSAARKAANNIAYGAAGRQADAAAAANIGPATEIGTALVDPTVKPYADLARSNPKNAGASEGRIAMDAYRLMSEDQIGNTKWMKENGKSASRITANDILGAAKDRLRTAMASDMPGFPSAVMQNRVAKGQEEAMQQGADIAQTAFSGRHIAGKKLDTKSVAAFGRDAKSMTPDELQKAASGILGRLKENPKLAHVPYTRLPLPFPSAAVRRTPGLLDLVGHGSSFPQVGGIGPLAGYGLLNAFRSP